MVNLSSLVRENLLFDDIKVVVDHTFDLVAHLAKIIQIKLIIVILILNQIFLVSPVLLLLIGLLVGKLQSVLLISQLLLKVLKHVLLHRELCHYFLVYLAGVYQDLLVGQIDVGLTLHFSLEISWINLNCLIFNIYTGPFDFSLICKLISQVVDFCVLTFMSLLAFLVSAL